MTTRNSYKWTMRDRVVVAYIIGSVLLALGITEDSPLGAYLLSVSAMLLTVILVRYYRFPRLRWADRIRQIREDITKE